MGATNARIAFSFAAVMIFSVIAYYRIDIPVAIFCKGLDTRILYTFEWISTWGESTWYLVVAFVLFLCFKRIRRREVFANRALFVFASMAVSGIVDLVRQDDLRPFSSNDVFSGGPVRF